ncbi:MAG: thioredoxin [Ferruginibacter sp.]
MNNFEKLIASSTPLLVDFSAEWCGPCKMMPAILAEVKRKVGDKATIIKMDIDRNPTYAQLYDVQSVPTLMIFQNGKLVWRKSGVTQAGEIMRQLPIEL